MSVITYEGTVENGRIRLPDGVRLPEHAKVYIVVPDAQEPLVAHIYSPRLADRRDAARFTMEVVEEPEEPG